MLSLSLVSSSYALPSSSLKHFARMVGSSIIRAFQNTLISDWRLNEIWINSCHLRRVAEWRWFSCTLSWGSGPIVMLYSILNLSTTNSLHECCGWAFKKKRLFLCYSTILFPFFYMFSPYKWFQFPTVKSHRYLHLVSIWFKHWNLKFRPVVHTP